MDKDHSLIIAIRDGLMERRTVILGGEISQESISTAGSHLLHLQMQSNTAINLIIDSGGGSIEAALGLCDLMTNIMTAPVRGIAFGECGSAATFIMLHCTHRLGTPYSRFLIHSGSASNLTIPLNQSTSQNLEQLLRDAKTTEEVVTQLYMRKLTAARWNEHTPDDERRAYVQKLIARGDQPFDNMMSAEEAVEAGLIEQVVTGKLDIFA